MAQSRLLHVVHLTLRTTTQIASALRSARLAHERAQDGSMLLFFCDLPDAGAQALPQDTALVRCVQSGVMSMAARRRGQYSFLVRKRVFSALQRAWLGENQPSSVRQAIRALLSGEFAVPLEASNFSPASLKDAFDAALIVSADLRTTPDTPARMLAQLQHASAGALRGEVRIPFRREEPLFTRLSRLGFSLLPELSDAFHSKKEPLAAIYAPNALTQPPPEDTAQDCVFLLHAPPALSDSFARASLDYTERSDRLFLLPIAQVLLLFLAGFTGWQPAAVLAIALAELRALIRPRQLPCALVRLAFLPSHALLAVNALLKRRFSKSKLCPSLSCGPGACVFFGAALLFLALHSAGALVILLAVSLLWLSAPLLERALALPVRERIPLDEGEQKQLRALAESAFFDLSPQAASPSHLLAACMGCALNLLEPDEAARRADGMLPALKPASAFDCACILAAAQFFKERMADCDAALRELPARLEALADAQPDVCEDGLLAALLRIARDNKPAPPALAALKSAANAQPLQTLFLPRERIIADEEMLPLTHPHTFLKRMRLLPTQGETQKNDPPPQPGKADRFLILSCAALGETLSGLLLRSSRIAPYAPLLDLA